MLSTPNIKGSDIDFLGAARISKERYEESPEIMLSEGDILLTKDGSTIGTVNIVRELPEPATVNGSIAVITPKPSLEGRFLYWVIASQYAQSIFRRLRDGMGVPHLFQRDINRIKIPFPPRDEQRAIADFLDRETAQIDTLIARQQHLIATLRERRTAVITRTVTHGVGASPLKPVANRWLDKIPPHWQLSRFRFVAHIAAEMVDPADPRWSNEILIAPNHVESGTGRLLATETVADQGADSNKYRVRRGELVYSKIRPALNKAVIAPLDCLCSADMYPITLSAAVDPTFGLFYMLSQPVLDYVTERSMRVKMPKVNREELANLPWPLPPIDEQRAIGSAILEQTAAIDTLIQKSERLIELSQERRAALITAAVTGQIDVWKAA